jgi:hypothetical protein
MIYDPWQGIAPEPGAKTKQPLIYMMKCTAE